MFSTTPWFLEGKLFKKDSVKVIKTQKSHHKTKFFVICNNPRIASTKTQSIFCNKNVFCERQDSEKTNISWYQSWNIWVFLKQKSVSELLTFENNPKVMKFHKKLSRERWQVINFSPLSSQIRENVLKLKLSLTDFYIWHLKLTSRFKTRTTKLAFSKRLNTKVKKTYKSKKFTLVTRH